MQQQKTPRMRVANVTIHSYPITYITGVFMSYSTHSHSSTLFARAQNSIPGGVNSPVRAFHAVGGTPRFIQKAHGARLYDADGNAYIDYIGSWGPMILGHGHPAVLEAVQRAAADGLSFGAPTEREIELAETMMQCMPSLEMVRLVNSGTEAAMSAIRLARGATQRNTIIKFAGCYHGHADALLVQAGSGLASASSATSAGVPDAVVQDTVVLPYNDTEQLEAAFRLHGNTLAGVIIEPIAGNMNFVRAQREFLLRLRALCSQYGALLILDEVMTGFRVALGGAQSLYGISPDITVLGKIVGGGMPLAAFGGRRDIMQHLAPLGGVYQAGTLSGNPIATACGLATLHEISQPDFYPKLQAKTQRLTQGIVQAAQRHGLDCTADYAGGMFGFFMLAQLPRNYQQVTQASTQKYGVLFHSLLEQGVYIAPAMFEVGFMSAAHSESDIDATIAAFDCAWQAVQRKPL